MVAAAAPANASAKARNEAISAPESRKAASFLLLLLLLLLPPASKLSAPPTKYTTWLSSGPTPPLSNLAQRAHAVGARRLFDRRARYRK